jgi:hypothetical protein
MLSNIENQLRPHELKALRRGILSNNIEEMTRPIYPRRSRKTTKRKPKC